jgi:predicted transcriptional regulator
MARKKQVGRTVGKKSVDVKTFVSTVMAASRRGLSQTWVANELNVTPAAVSLRCKYLRDNGVKGLPEFPRGNPTTGSRIDIKALNDLVRSCRS